MKKPDRKKLDRKKLDRSIAVLGLAVAWCGVSAGCGGSSPPDLTPYLGTWSVAASAITVLCDDNRVQAISVTEPLVMIEGTRSDLIADDSICPVLYDVSDGAAHALPNQICNRTDVITRMHLVEGTFTPDTAAGMAKLAGSGTLEPYINISVGNTVHCTYNQMGVYRRTGF
jgi:hypothetical protein